MDLPSAATYLVTFAAVLLAAVWLVTFDRGFRPRRRSKRRRTPYD